MRTIGPYFLCSLAMRGPYSPEMTWRSRHRLVHPATCQHGLVFVSAARRWLAGRNGPARKGPGYFLSGDVWYATKNHRNTATEGARTRMLSLWSQTPARTWARSNSGVPVGRLPWAAAGDADAMLCEGHSVCNITRPRGN